MRPFILSPHNFLIFVLSLAAGMASASSSERLRTQTWPAQWIAPPTASLTDYGVFHFRNGFDLERAPDTFRVHVTADNRYQLLVNGERVARGPDRGDLMNWPYESLDIAPFLRPGRNVLAAVVWNAGEQRPMAQHTLVTGFLLQADLPAHDTLVNTGAGGWRVMENPAYAPEPVANDDLRTYIVVGPGDFLDGRLHPWGWEQPGFDAAGWAAPRVITRGQPRGTGTDIKWQLRPREIPMLEESIERLEAIRRAEGVGADPAFIRGTGSLEIPANTRARLLLDHGRLTMGYPVVRVSGGAGAEVRLAYAEALFDANRRKGNRDVIEGKTLIGMDDRFIADGGEAREFSPLWMRTFRYLELEVTTAGSPLTIEDLHHRFWAYPFEEQARFDAGDPMLDRIWDIGWRTARLCAGETYFDCPYYEQLQYVGDTRIQALISLYVSGDDRLMRKAIRLYDQSRFYEGLTRSRYPSHDPQVIPTYSLFWVNMVHDYYMHREDPAFLREQRLGIITVLDWYARQIDPRTGLIGQAPFWNFVDWTEEWDWDPDAGIGGVPDLAGGSAILSLQAAYAFDDAARLFEAFGEPSYADQYRARSAGLKQAVRRHCWDAGRGLFADTPARASYSQHANLWAILTDTVHGAEAERLLEKVLHEPDLIMATFYFKFYLFQALYHTGQADRYLDALEPWRDMVRLGLTTFAEKPDPTRSDCHAWSASPNYDLLATVCGIRPASPGFQTVSIRPSLGELEQVQASMPHPKGSIALELKREGDALRAVVTLPRGVRGQFFWEGESRPIRGGRQILEF